MFDVLELTSPQLKSFRLLGHLHDSYPTLCYATTNRPQAVLCCRSCPSHFSHYRVSRSSAANIFACKVLLFHFITVSCILLYSLLFISDYAFTLFFHVLWKLIFISTGLINITHMYILTLRRLMSYIYGAPILDVSRSHTTTHYSR